jgi:hypothetical protein
MCWSRKSVHSGSTSISSAIEDPLTVNTLTLTHKVAEHEGAGQAPSFVQTDFSRPFDCDGCSERNA